MIQDGVEFFTIDSTGESGMWQSSPPNAGGSDSAHPLLLLPQTWGPGANLILIKMVHMQNQMIKIWTHDRTRLCIQSRQT